MYIRGIQSGFEEAKKGAELALKIYEIAKEDVLSPSYLEWLKKLDEIFPDAVETLYFYGVLALNQGNKDVAQTLLLQAWKKRKLNSNVVYALGSLFQWHDNELVNIPSSLLEGERFPYLRFLYAYLLSGMNNTFIQKMPEGFLWKYYCVMPYMIPMSIHRIDNNIPKGKVALYVPLPYGGKDNYPPYRVGLCNERDYIGKDSIVLNCLYANDNIYKVSGDIDFDIMRMDENMSLTFQTDKNPFVIYLLASEDNEINVSYNGGGEDRYHSYFSI